ncbi:hypothetical protein DB32_005720 [Sandaracinus amylolyticus]|uniref:Uncharacterized protein n=1 Tax=Sandaracinus amylolyticus TaxID=927083 RepID=A0A0F6W6K8_9BACT|nr:hypothetical protein DB32_005720 [Sandaracinus amylolyticus]
MSPTSNTHGPHAVVSRAGLIVAGLLFAAALFVAPSRAEARGPLYAGFGLGPYVLVAHDYADAFDDAHFRTSFEFGIHFSRDDTGFFIAFEAVPTFGDWYVMFFGGMRLGGDIEVYANRDIGVIVRPSGLIGGGIWDPDGRDNDLAYLVLQPAFDLRLALADRLMHLWIRPVSFDLLFYPDWYDGDFHFDAGYSFMAGLDFNF